MLDHEELRVPTPLAADVVETELRFDNGAFSILGILIMKMKKYETGDESEIGKDERAGTVDEQTEKATGLGWVL